jgi:hypothetical protein
MKKITSLIEEMNNKELTELKQKLEEGIVKKEVEQKLERFKNLNKVCPICNTPVGEEGLTLIFGPPDLKQRATFDGKDCLTYFLTKVRK